MVQSLENTQQPTNSPLMPKTTFQKLQDIKNQLAMDLELQPWT